jgi:hypothetical protein
VPLSFVNGSVKMQKNGSLKMHIKKPETGKFRVVKTDKLLQFDLLLDNIFHAITFAFYDNADSMM